MIESLDLTISDVLSRGGYSHLDCVELRDYIRCINNMTSFESEIEVAIAITNWKFLHDLREELQAKDVIEGNLCGYYGNLY